MLSSQAADISKWKSRAIKLKVKSKADVDKPGSPGTPTNRGLSMTSDSSKFMSSPKKFLATPKKILDSSIVSQLDLPKSRFFDEGSSSDLLSRTCPKQFFDNSGLGSLPGKLHSALAVPFYRLSVLKEMFVLLEVSSAPDFPGAGKGNWQSHCLAPHWVFTDRSTRCWASLSSEPLTGLRCLSAWAPFSQTFRPSSVTNYKRGVVGPISSTRLYNTMKIQPLSQQHSFTGALYSI